MSSIYVQCAVVFAVACVIGWLVRNAVRHRRGSR